jgi:nucleotidyltransferase/DNA polymerase involved in DNA repair
MMARLATRKAKPDGSYYLNTSGLATFIERLDIQDLHGFGWSTREKTLKRFGTTNLGQLAKQSKGALCGALGKVTGETLWKAIRGIDDRKLESDKPRKSVSCEINVCQWLLKTLMGTNFCSTASALKITSKPSGLSFRWRKKFLVVFGLFL